MTLLLLACAPESPTRPEGLLACAPFADSEVDKHLGDPPRAARTLTGAMSFAVDFDAAAEATGKVDCTYVREYPLLPEITDQGWLCPECEWYTKGEATVVSGYEDCYLQLSSYDATRTEHIGFVRSGGSYAVWRAGTENLTMEDTGARIDPGDLAKGVTVAWSDGGELETGGSVSLRATGTLTSGTSETLLVNDPAGARTEPYACDWPLQSPGGEVGDWSPDAGGVFPNARLVDQCGEQADLWDFRGRYVIVDAASPDCGPCQLMAEGAEAFKAEMADRCIHVETITLLNESVQGVNKPAAAETIDAWVEAFGVIGPVLADEGFGYDVIAPLVSESDGMALPSAVVLGPDGTLLGGDHGYSEEDGWGRYGRFIPGG